jgi:16S rRNA (guanine(527)-N(7))-methyltransferase RsmG
MFHVKHEAWAKDASALGLSLSDDQFSALETYRDVLLSHALPRGLVAASDRDRLWERHILDGLRGALEIGPGATVLDLGSGAGIPGVPLAVALPGTSLTLCEPRRGRVAFLEMVRERLGLSNVQVFPRKAEVIGVSFGTCVARAFSSAAGTWAVAEHLLTKKGVLVYWAGGRFEPSQMDDLGVDWRLSTRSDLADSGPLVIMGRQ